jgi:hypothetical protein
MATPDDVEIELTNPNDLFVLYEGAPFAYRTGSLRNWVGKLAWDLLRFQKVGTFTNPLNPNDLFGMRDAITRILWETNQNNLILRRLAQAGNVNITDITG